MGFRGMIEAALQRFPAIDDSCGVGRQPRPERGTSPSPRVVFDCATFPIPAPSGFRPPPERRRAVGGLSKLSWRVVCSDQLPDGQGKHSRSRKH